MTQHLFLGSALSKSKPVFRGTPGYTPIPLDENLKMEGRSLEDIRGKELTDEIRHYITIAEAKLKWKREREKAKKILSSRNKMRYY